eukprot:1159910-Pelagomonas_calceolata.AAC.4
MLIILVKIFTGHRLQEKEGLQSKRLTCRAESPVLHNYCFRSRTECVRCDVRVSGVLLSDEERAGQPLGHTLPVLASSRQCSSHLENALKSIIASTAIDI